ncbi:MAG: hypothetical protein ACI9VN_003618 [Patescibacteria group bacterium]|jgi:hypothetical protein
MLRHNLPERLRSGSIFPDSPKLKTNALKIPNYYSTMFNFINQEDYYKHEIEQVKRILKTMTRTENNHKPLLLSSQSFFRTLTNLNLLKYQIFIDMACSQNHENSNVL